MRIAANNSIVDLYRAQTMPVHETRESVAGNAPEPAGERVGNQPYVQPGSSFQAGQPVNGRPDLFAARPVVVLDGPADKPERGKQPIFINSDVLAGEQEKVLKRLGIKECLTCKNRKYQDRSNDAGVSFKSPTHLSPEQALSVVAGHEQEHLTNERVDADLNGREVVYQNVQIQTSICPECGRVYVSGGKATTATREATPREADAGQADAARQARKIDC
jgi:hypothetical protein